MLHTSFLATPQSPTTFQQQKAFQLAAPLADPPLLHPAPQFDIPATYPTTAPEIELPELEGKTAKMYRGGKICLTVGAAVHPALC